MKECVEHKVFNSFDFTIFFWKRSVSLAIVTCIPIARQGLGKHIHAGTNARYSRTSIARQRRGKNASSTIEAAFFVWSMLKGYVRTQSEDTKA
jgi:hypothetical protein